MSVMIIYTEVHVNFVASIQYVKYNAYYLTHTYRFVCHLTYLSMIENLIFVFLLWENDCT